MAQFTLDIRNNLAEEFAKFEKATKDDLARAVPVALNKTLITARAEAVRSMKSVYRAMPVRALKKMILFKRASVNFHAAVLTFSNQKIPLIWVGGFRKKFVRNNGSYGIADYSKLPDILQTAKSARLNFKPGTLFFATMRSGYYAIFARRGAHRLPIDEIYAGSMSQVFVDKHIEMALMRVSRPRFLTVLRQELKFRTANG